MASNAFVQSIKTIAESLIRKAGFDKTRSGKVVGVNSLTNTYSVKIDGHVYSNVRVANDATYNVGDTVKVNIPCNQMSQAYITASIFSDSSIGKKIGHAESLINAIDGSLEDVKEIDGHIYQLDIQSVYQLEDEEDVEYSQHYGFVYEDGISITSSQTSKLRWYFMTSAGKQRLTQGIVENHIRIDIEDYIFGMVLMLEWVDANENVLLRKETVIVNNEKIMDFAIEADNAYTLADNTDNYFWFVESGTDTGAHITYQQQDAFESALTDAQRGYNLLAKPNGVALRYGYKELAQLLSNALNFNVIDANGYQRKAMSLAQDSLTFYDGQSTEYEVAKFSGSDGVTLKNSRGYTTMRLNSNGLKIYDGSAVDSDNVMLANFGTTSAQIGRNDQSHVTLDTSNMKFYTAGDGVNPVATFGASSMQIGKSADGHITMSQDAQTGDVSLEFYKSSGRSMYITAPANKVIDVSVTQFIEDVGAEASSGGGLVTTFPDVTVPEDNITISKFYLNGIEYPIRNGNGWYPSFDINDPNTWFIYYYDPSDYDVIFVRTEGTLPSSPKYDCTFEFGYTYTRDTSSAVFGVHPKIDSNPYNDLFVIGNGTNALSPNSVISVKADSSIWIDPTMGATAMGESNELVAQIDRLGWNDVYDGNRDQINLKKLLANIMKKLSP